MTEARPAYGWRGRVGIIVPPANTTVEPEIAAMMPAGVSLHATRLPGRVVDETAVGLKERFEGYNRAMAETALSFGGARLSAMCLGVTGSCYLVGPDGEATILAQLRASGAPHVMTAARAIRRLLAALGRERIGLVAPYPAWVIDFARSYWRASGLEVAAIEHVPDVVSFYAVDTERVVATAEAVLSSGVEAVVLSGTGVVTLPAIERLAHRTNVPVISSNLSLGWWILETLGIDAAAESPSAALKAVHRWLAASDARAKEGA